MKYLLAGIIMIHFTWFLFFAIDVAFYISHRKWAKENGFSFFEVCIEDNCMNDIVIPADLILALFIILILVLK